MATKFSPCKGSYVLNQFPSNVMFGMNGFHVSASGAIHGHHGPLVFFKVRVEILGPFCQNLDVEKVQLSECRCFFFLKIWTRRRPLIESTVGKELREFLYKCICIFRLRGGKIIDLTCRGNCSLS